MLEKYFIDPDKAHIEAKKSEVRQAELLLSNLKYKLIGELRTLGAIKVDVFAFDKSENEVRVKAKFHLKGNKQGEFVFKKNHLGNFVLKNLEASIDNAELVQMQAMTPLSEEMLECKMTFDLGLIQAKEQELGIYEIFYPTTGHLGTLKSSNADVQTIKRLCALAAEHFGLKPEFVNGLKITKVNDAQIPLENQSGDKVFTAQQEIKSYVSNNNAEKEKNRFLTLRSNFVKSIENQAQDIVKKSTTSYKTGVTKIVSADTVLEYVDNKFDGSVLVKAKIGDLVKTFALPVVMNALHVVKAIDEYKINQTQYKDELNKKIDADIKKGMAEDMSVIEAEMLADKELMGAMPVKGARVSEIQKSFKMNKDFLPKELGIGDIFTGESGCEYIIQGNEGDVVYTLVLVN
jgi:hypothetical protein